MKSATLPRAEDKQTVRRALSTSNILYAAVGRLYVSYSHNPEWIYSGVWGAVAFCKDRSKNGSYFIRIVDMENERGVIWEQELYNGFEYIKDCSYFHTFDTDDYFAGILFVHQGEANAYHDLVIGRDTVKLKNNTPKSTFGRVGYSKEHGFTVDNNDPEIIAILKELEKSGDFSPADIIANQEFIQEFIIQYQANNQKQTSKNKRLPAPPPPPSKNRQVSPVSSSGGWKISSLSTKSNTNIRQSSFTSSAPHPPAPPAPSFTAPPPPPNQSPSFTIPPPPPPPNPSSNFTISPPLPPNQSSSFTIPPPPPPPPPNFSTPPPPTFSAPTPPAAPSFIPPPPPPPPQAPSGNVTHSTAPPPVVNGNDGRANLMSSIRSSGGIGSLRKSKSSKANTVNSSQSSLSRSVSQQNNQTGEAGFTSSLANVLQQRKAVMLGNDDSDDSDDDDDWK